MKKNIHKIIRFIWFAEIKRQDEFRTKEEWLEYAKVICFGRFFMITFIYLLIFLSISTILNGFFKIWVLWVILIMDHIIWNKYIKIKGYYIEDYWDEKE